MHKEPAPTTTARSGPVVGDSPFVTAASTAMRGLEGVVENVAGSDVPVLILGESGSGKRALALQIHQRSQHREQPFHEILCSHVSGELFSQIAGLGNGNGAPAGTLFLNEIAELPAAYQSKLAQLFFKTNGHAAPRLIASSRHNLEQEIRAGRFREELYYRISGVCLRVPPLRMRREDILGFTDHFLEKYAALFGKPKPVLTAATSRFLLDHNWPGNVRELEDLLKTIVAIGDERIALAAIRSSLAERRRGHEGLESVSLKEAARAASRQAEREIILRVLSRTRWNRKRAAQELQISYKALLYKLKQIGLDDEVNGREEMLI